MVSDYSCSVVKEGPVGLTVPTGSAAVVGLLPAYPCHRHGAVLGIEGRCSSFRHLLCSDSESNSTRCELCLSNMTCRYVVCQHFNSCFGGDRGGGGGVKLKVELCKKTFMLHMPHGDLIQKEIKEREKVYCVLGLFYCAKNNGFESLIMI